ncbi:MAG: PqqD family peptide modification chaperone [Anaerolineae bacterium]|nr:PqqD family peptide modification chaperone [Anaerolineae bacterium]
MTNETPEINIETPLKRAENILFSEIDQDKVMIDIERGAYFGMNPVAGEIWDLLEAPLTPQQVIQKLMSLYEVDAETCQTETLQVLQRMVRLKLVEVAG